jgi:16S rRNA G966 N2-methylase RsmD
MLDRFRIIAEKHKAKKIPMADYQSLRPTDKKDE